MNLNNILVGSDDPQRLADYFTKLFGEPVFSGGGYTSFRIGDGGITIGPHSEVHGQNKEPGRIIWNVESNDVKGDFARLVAAGATVVREPYSMTEDGQEAWIATLSDPDGNYFQLTTPFEMS